MINCLLVREHALIIAAVLPVAAAGASLLDVEQDERTRPSTTAPRIETTLVEQPQRVVTRYWWVPDGTQSLNRLLAEGHSYRSMGWP